MGSDTIKLPLINLSNLKKGTPTWESVKVQVREALEDYGCFEATFDEIPVHLRESVIEETQKLFDLPLEVKLRNRSSRPYHGYIGQYAQVPLYESLGIDDALSAGKLDAFAGLLWPQGNPTFRESVLNFSEKLSEADKTVRRMVLESLGLEDHVDEHVASTNYLVRLQKYDAPPTPETQLGLTSHTDKNIVTILYQNQVQGLEILTKDGHWITPRPEPNSFILMIGDSFSAWTNGRLHSPHHRVMMSGTKARYSIGVFSIPKPGCIIKAPEALVDEEHPLLFKPFDHHKFLDFYYSPAGRTSPAALKAYCGL